MPLPLHRFLTPLPPEEPSVPQQRSSGPGFSWDTPAVPVEPPAPVSPWRKYAAMGTRGLAGLLSMEGMWPGAAISGGGEALAQTLEGDSLDPKRIAAEAAIGAVPFHTVFGGAKLAEALTRGALYGGGGEALREVARGEDLSPSSIGLGAAVAGGMSSLGHFFGVGGVGKTAPKVVEETKPISLQSLPDEVAAKIEAEHPIPLKAKVPIQNPKVTTALGQYLHTPEGQGGVGSRAYQGKPMDMATQIGEQERLKRSMAENIPLDQTPEQFVKAQAAEKAAQDAADEAQSIREALIARGAEPQLSYSTRSTAPIAGGTETGSMTLKMPKAAKEGGLTNDLTEAVAAARAAEAVAPTGRGIVPPVSDQAYQDLTGHPRLGVSQAVELVPSETSNLAEFLTPGAKRGSRSVKTVEGFNKGVEDILAKLGGKPTETIAPAIEGPKTPLIAGAEAQVAPTVSETIPATIRPPEPPISAAATASQEPGLEAPPVFRNPAHQQAYETMPPEAYAALENLWGKYNALPLGERKASGLGKQLAEIRDFFTPGKMRESWKGAPLEGPTPAPAAKTAYSIPGTDPEAAARAAGRPFGPAADAETIRINQEGAAPSMGPSPSTDKWGTADAVREMLGVKAPKGGSEAGFTDLELLTRLGLAGGGAAVGYATDPLDDPTMSAIAGGTAGVLGPEIIKGLRSIPNVTQKLSTQAGITEVAQRIGRDLPSFQRFNLLMSSHGLAANAIVGPAGSAFFGALEHGLSGDPRGWQAIKLLASGSWTADVPAAIEKAREVIGRAEGTAMTTASNRFEQVMAVPGVALSTGDIVMRKVLTDVGFSEDEAARIILTSEPWSQIGKNVVNLGRGTALGQFLAPFRRTTMNIAEQAAERAPGLGFLTQAQRVRMGGEPDSMALQAIKQGVGVGVGAGAEQIAENTDPDNANTVRRYVSNFAGANSLPAAIGFAIGQARQAGKPVDFAALREVLGALPLPTTRPVSDLYTAGQKTLEGEPTLPRSAYPGLFRELYDWYGPGGGGVASPRAPVARSTARSR